MHGDFEAVGSAPLDVEADVNWPRFPYPGLRPFRLTPDADESLIFCGRNRQSDENSRAPEYVADRLGGRTIGLRQNIVVKAASARC